MVCGRAGAPYTGEGYPSDTAGHEQAEDPYDAREQRDGVHGS